MKLARRDLWKPLAVALGGTASVGQIADMLRPRSKPWLHVRPNMSAYEVQRWLNESVSLYAGGMTWLDFEG